MNLENFTRFDGRHGRQSWWLGTIVMLVIAIILYFILSAVMGTGLSAMTNPEELLKPGVMESYMRSTSIQQLITLVLLGYPVTALMSRRLNDRDRPGWLKWLFWVPTVIATILGLTGMAYTVTDVGNGIMLPTPSMLMTIVSLLSLAMGVWALIELGFLRGSDGPNQHGPDPIAE
jgi:uncharacterized membrane protein YhaH (DUF805 family)